MAEEKRKFRFLTNADFELLTQPEKVAYLTAAMEALHGEGRGWGSVFADPKPGTMPPDPASKTEDRQEP